jgi:hypothetical protein
MFNSPLQYCVKCTQYVELDQTEEECAALRECGGVNCPLLKMFRPPAPSSDGKPALTVEPPTSLKPGS